MRLDVTQLLREPIGTHTDVEFNLGFQHLAEDLPVDSIRGRLTLLRTDEEILVRGILQVAVALECGRCLAPTTTTLHIELDERFRPISLGKVQEDDQVSVIDADNQLDLRPVLKDLVTISIPMHVVCRPDCLGLCPECGQNLNEGPCNCPSDDIDPRLVALKALLK
jgi:uncharacterized protein